jgi:PAS domain S-box-containing protein
MRHAHTRRNILNGLIISLSVIAIFLVISYRNIRIAVVETKKVDNTMISLRSLEDLMNDMQDIEGSHRGYVISGNRRFLDTYFPALKRLQTDSGALITTTANFPHRRETIEKLMHFVREKAAFASYGIGLMERNQRDSANYLVQTGTGKSLMDSIRSTVFFLESQDRVMLQQFNSQRQQAARSSARSLIFLVSALLAGILILFWRIYRELEEKKVRDKKIGYLASLTEKTSDAIFSTDVSGKLISWNKAAEERFGYSAEEVIGKTAATVMRSLHANEAIVGQFQQLPERGSTTFETINYTKKGDPLYSFASVTALRDERDLLIGYVTILRDITERRKSEQLLEKFNEELNRKVEEKTAEIKASEERYRQIVETAHDGIWMIDSDYRTTFVNKRMAQMLGYSREEMIGKPVYDFVFEEDKMQTTTNLRHRQEGVSEELEFKFKTKNGRGIWTLLSASPMFTHGQFTGILAMVMDITERKKALDAIRRSNESFELIARTTNDAIWEWNLESDQLWANETNQQLYGLTINDPVPTEEAWASRIHPEDRDTIVNRQRDALESDVNVFISEYRFNTANKGYRNIYDRCYIVRNQEGKPIRMTGSMMDITERKKTEEALQKSEAEARFIFEYSPIVIWEEDFSDIKKYMDNLVQRGYTDLRHYLDTHPEELKKLADMIKIIRINQKSLDFYGARSKEEVFSHFPGRFSEESLRVFKEEILALYAGELVFESELPTYMPDGSKRQIIISVSVPPVYQSTFEKVLFSFIDITDRKKAEESRRAEEETRKLIMNAALDAIICIDTSSIVTVWTPQSENIFGWTAEEAIGRPLAELIIPLIYRDQHIRGMKRFLQTGEGPLLNRIFEISAINKQGKEFPIELSVTRINQDESTFFCAFIRDITLRKQAEKTIAESENRLRTIINSEPQCIKVLDNQFRLLEMNPAGLAMIEAESFEQVKGHSVLQLVNENYHESFKKLTDAVFNDRPGTLQFSITGLKGTKRWLETHAVPMKNAEGTIISMLGVTVDITARKKAEEELMESEEKYRTLVEQAVDAIALYDAGGKILDVNTGSANLLGYSKDELLQMYLHDILTPEEIIEKPVRYDVLQSGESTVKQRKMRRKNGVIIETEVRSQQLPDGRFLSVIRDLSERIKSQKIIEEEKRLSDKLINSLPGIFYWHDRPGRFLRWNKEMELITGYSAQEIGNMYCLDFFDEKDKAYIAERMDLVFTEGVSDAEAEIVAKDGSRHLYYFKALRFDFNNIPCLLGTGIDVSDRKKAEQELAASHEMLRQLTEHLQNIREEERSHIAREIHDELGQQLTVLKMDISWLNKRMGSEDRKIRDRMEELVEMIDTTVRSVRKISSELRPSMLDDLGLAAALEWQGQEFEKRSGIKVNMSMEAPDIRLPNHIAITLFRIFQESITNVARHAEASEVNVLLKTYDHKLEMVIRDNGKGFVVQGIENKKTLGILGMRERISIINGEYKIESSPGKGTKVIVNVPLTESE